MTAAFTDLAAQIVANQQRAFAAEAAKRRGISGAMDTYWPRPERQEVVAERLANQHRDRQTFLASPRGRFVQAIDALRETGAYDTEFCRLSGFYGRTISALNGPLGPEGVVAVAECIAILNGIVGRDARAAVDALTDLLREEAPAIGAAA
jgi:hypothetical protein